jgi:hypothetical protein
MDMLDVMIDARRPPDVRSLLRRSLARNPEAGTPIHA